MANYKSMFLQYMDSKDIRYTELDEFVVGIGVSGENIDAIHVLVIFEEDGNPAVQLRCSNFIGFSGKEIRGIIACNKINNELRWVKFCMDSNGDIVATMDTYFDGASCGEECIKLVKQFVRIIDMTYPTFAHAFHS
jgi:hypothetical protein